MLLAEEQLYTVQEVAKSLRVHPESVRRWIRDKKLKAIRLGRGFRVPEQELARVRAEGIDDEDAE